MDSFLADFTTACAFVGKNPLRPKTYELLSLHEDMAYFGSSIDTSAGM